MALFGGSRDISLFRHLNRELLNEIIDTRCDIYKYSIFDSKENLYGEALNKVFKPGVRVAGLIDKEGKEYTSEELGADFTRQVKFSFLRDDLADLENSGTGNTTNPNLNHQEADIFLEIGDVIHWDNNYHEIDTVSSGQYLFGKNPATDSNSGTHGSSWSVIVETHEMRRSKIATLEKVRAGYDEYISGTKIDEQRGGLYG
tara:strand:- start:856 stop:1458 length:603 start_codon:yes stop_codon:yes gene_type:complete